MVVLRTRTLFSTKVGALVEHSRRQVRGFVGLQKMLEQDLYLIVCLAFNHWHIGELEGNKVGGVRVMRVFFF